MVRHLVVILTAVAALGLAVASTAAARTVPIRGGDGTTGPAYGRAGATWTAWKIRGVQVGIRLGRVSVAGFTSQWTEGHSLIARVGLRCRYPSMKRPVTPGYPGPTVRVSATAGVPLSATVPGVSARCLAPSRYVGVSFLGLVLKPDVHPAYVARLAGAGFVPS